MYKPWPSHRLSHSGLSFCCVPQCKAAGWCRNLDRLQRWCVPSNLCLVYVCSSQMEVEELKRAIHLTWSVRSRWQRACRPAAIAWSSEEEEYGAGNRTNEEMVVTPQPPSAQSFFNDLKTTYIFVRFTFCTYRVLELGVIKIQMYISVLFFFFLPTRQAKNKNPEALLVTTVLDGCASAAVLPAPLLVLLTLCKAGPCFPHLTSILHLMVHVYLILRCIIWVMTLFRFSFV